MPVRGELTIIDHNGQPVPQQNIAPAVAGQIFDVIVGPNGSFQFDPPTINIAVGDTVRWTWGSSFHSVTSGNPCVPDSQFCSPNDMNCSAHVLSEVGAVYQHIFTQAGNYSYFCALHCEYGMTGTIHVADLVQVVSAVSAKSHPSPPATFDVNLPLNGTPGVECRTGGATSDYTMVVTFAGNVTVTGSPQAQVTQGIGCVGSGGTCSGNVSVSGNTVTIPLTNIGNAQTINVRLNGVNNAAATNAPATDITIPMSILISDTNANGTVNAMDVAQTKARLGQAVDIANFRSDVNANGSINAADTAIVKQNSGTSLPP
jgi:plastocyanin